MRLMTAIIIALLAIATGAAIVFILSFFINAGSGGG